MWMLLFLLKQAKCGSVASFKKAIVQSRVLSSPSYQDPFLSMPEDSASIKAATLWLRKVSYTSLWFIRHLRKTINGNLRK